MTYPSDYGERACRSGLSWSLRSPRRLRRSQPRAAVLGGRLLAVQGQAARREDDVRVMRAFNSLLRLAGAAVINSFSAEDVIVTVRLRRRRRVCALRADRPTPRDSRPARQAPGAIWISARPDASSSASTVRDRPPAQRKWTRARHRGAHLQGPRGARPRGRLRKPQRFPLQRARRKRKRNSTASSVPRSGSQLPGSPSP